MPTLPVRWLLPVLILFLAAFGADLYLSNSAEAAREVTPTAKRGDALEFLDAAATGVLSDGRSTYRANLAGLADPAATRDRELTQTAARFTEQDVISAARARPRTARDRIAVVTHGTMQGLGLLLFVGIVIVALQRVTGRTTSFGSNRLRSAKSKVDFASVAGCDEAKDE